MKIKSIYLNAVKRVLPFYLLIFLPFSMKAEDGHQLWLRYQPVNKAKVTGPECIAAQELRTYYQGEEVRLVVDPTMQEDAYSIKGEKVKEISAKNEIGLLYGAYELLRRQGNRETGKLDITSKPFYKLRILNHWDNLNGTIERGYAGLSIFWQGKPGGKAFHGHTIFVEDPNHAPDLDLIKEYARANASIGINGTVLNNVNASPKIINIIYKFNPKFYHK